MIGVIIISSSSTYPSVYDLVMGLASQPNLPPWTPKIQHHSQEYPTCSVKYTTPENIVRQHWRVQFLGGTSLLTGPTDEHWKLVRKAVAPAFSQGNMRCVLSPLCILCGFRHQ